jgi:hypothetical protein
MIEIENYVWKGEKKKFGGETFQETFKLLDCTKDQLQEFYNHCKVMLYNESKSHPGRYVLLKIIADQRNRCGAELFLRDLEKKAVTRFSLMESIRKFLDNNKDEYNKLRQYNLEHNRGPVTVDFVASGCADEYKNLPLDLVIDGCLDRLGTLTQNHIT